MRTVLSRSKKQKRKGGGVGSTTFKKKKMHFLIFRKLFQCTHIVHLPNYVYFKVNTDEYTSNAFTWS